MTAKISGRGAAPPLSTSARTAATGLLQVSAEEIPREVIAKRLEIGSTLSARILEPLGNGRYLVGFAGLKMIAESPIDLAPGARLGVQVAATEPKIHLRILSGSEGADEMLRKMGFEKPDATLRSILSEFIEREMPLDRESVRRAAEMVRRGASPQEAARLIQNHLPMTEATLARAHASTQPFAASLDRLTAALEAAGRREEAMALRSSLTFDGDLERLLDQHPLRQERRLLAERPLDANTDAKGLLLSLADAKPETPAEREIASTARELLETIEGRFLLGDPSSQIPFVVEDEGTREGWLTAQRAKDRANLRFRVDTSGLGEVVGVIDFVGRTAGISFGVKSPEARKAMLASAPELNQSLAALGVRIESLTVDVLKRGETKDAAPVVAGLDIKA